MTAGCFEISSQGINKCRQAICHNTIDMTFSTIPDRVLVLGESSKELFLLYPFLSTFWSHEVILKVTLISVYCILGFLYLTSPTDHFQRVLSHIVRFLQWSHFTGTKFFCWFIFLFLWLNSWHKQITEGKIYLWLRLLQVSAYDQMTLDELKVKLNFKAESIFWNKEIHFIAEKAREQKWACQVKKKPSKQCPPVILFLHLSPTFDSPWLLSNVILLQIHQGINSLFGSQPLEYNYFQNPMWTINLLTHVSKDISDQIHNIPHDFRVGHPLLTASFKHGQSKVIWIACKNVSTYTLSIKANRLGMFGDLQFKKLKKKSQKKILKGIDL